MLRPLVPLLIVVLCAYTPIAVAESDRIEVNADTRSK